MKYESQGIYRSVASFVFVIVGMWYLHWRISTLVPESIIFSTMLYGAEIYGFVAALLHLMMTWRLTVHDEMPCRDGLSVDVFIATYNEPVDMVRKTLLAAMHMDYPHKTWLLDDGNRQDMKILADRLGANYLARTENTHAKAGNFNHAMTHSKGDFIAVFDADHAPQKNFLIKTLGYFTDESVAFVQTPQDFFNLDSYQHRWQNKRRRIWTEQALFFKVIQRGKDYWNAAFFCGTCAIIRRAALNKIGGFATETVTEDLHTSIRLHKAGFRSVYCRESLAFGIAPANISPFLKQRVRWGQGAMQVLRIENILFTRKLSIAQKLNYMASIMTYFDGWQKGIFYISPVVVLIFGMAPINVGTVDFLIHFIPYYALSIISFEAMGRGYGGIFYIEQYNFARFAAFAWATLSLFIGKAKFKVTSKDRGRSENFSLLFLPQLIIIVLNMIAIPFGLIMFIESQSLPLNTIGFNIAWAAFHCILGLTMLNFTLKTQRFLREEYRFPIPLPMVIHTEKNEIHGTIDNISVDGCRIYASLPDNAKKGDLLRGEFYLPSGPLPFEALILSEITGQNGIEKFVKAVGCHFIWNKVEHRDALEIFLYGSDLQRKLLPLQKDDRTPWQWISAYSIYPKPQPDKRWAACELIQVDTASIEQSSRFGLIPIPIGKIFPQELVTFQPLSIHTNTKVLIFTRTKNISMSVQLDSGMLLENSAGPVYLYPILKCEMLANTTTLTMPTMHIKKYNLGMAAK